MVNDENWMKSDNSVFKKLYNPLFAPNMSVVLGNIKYGQKVAWAEKVQTAAWAENFGPRF